MSLFKKHKLAKIGDVVFVVGELYFKKIDRSSSFEWKKKPLLKGFPTYQFLGIKSDTAKIQGVIVKEKGFLDNFFDSEDTENIVERLRELGNKGEPVLFEYTNDGKTFHPGYWVIKKITEGRSMFRRDGTNYKTEFAIELEKYDGKNRSFSIGR